MNKFKKLSQNFKKLATIAFASCTFALAFTGIPLFNAYAEATEGTLENGLKYTTLDTGVNQVVHYEFNDPNNLGKDSLGHYDLTTYGTVPYDNVNGGAVLGQGILYHAEQTDFSDLIEGSYTLTTRVMLRTKSANTGANIVGTGASAYAFCMQWSKNGPNFYYNNTNTSSGNFFNRNSSGVLSSTFAWYRYTFTYEEYDEATATETGYTGKVSYTFTKENDSSYTAKTGSQDLTSKISFGSTKHADYVFSIGGQIKYNGENSDREAFGLLPNDTTQKIYPTMSDLRVYAGVITDEELAAIEAEDAANLANVKTEAQVLAETSETVGATLRLTENSGLRFLATLNENTVNSLKYKYGEANVSFGTKLVRNHNGAQAYAYVPATNNTLADGVYSFNSVITELTEDYYGTEFTAQVYVQVNGDTYILSGEEKTRSISSVAQMALADLYEVGVDGSLEEKPADYKYELETGVWSPFHQTTREKLQVYVVE